MSGAALAGTAGVNLGLLSAVVGAVLAAVGTRRRQPAALRTARVVALGVPAGAVVAVVAMQWALHTDDFSLRYVATNHSRASSGLWTTATMWAALEGSILLWALVLAGWVTAVVVRFRARLSDPLVGVAVTTMLAVAAFFFALMAGPADPFTTVSPVPADGPGPNPLLQQHLLMAFHPPVLYLGYVGFTVPFAFAVAALVTGRVGEGWLLETRRWTLASWGFLSLGIVLGAWWSYEVLGWGGFWAWDPVENASLLPWLTATAYLHSVVVQERRGMLRVWNLSLVTATFALTILGTFLTRSGVIDSVHAFTTSDIGPWLLAGFGVVVAVSVGLIGWRGDLLASPGSVGSAASREAAFLVNNLLFAAFAFVVLLGTVFPMVVEALNGDRLSVGRPWFDRMTAPVGLALLFLMAVAPVLGWGRSAAPTVARRLIGPAWVAAGAGVVAVVSGARGPWPVLAFMLAGFGAGTAVRHLVLAVRRNRWRGLVGRTSGGMIVHLGVALIAVGLVAASSYATEAVIRLAPGETATVAGRRITYDGLETETHPNRTVTRAVVHVDGTERGPAINLFRFGAQGIGTPSVLPGVTADVYLTLRSVPEDPGGPVELGVLIQPLVGWLWAGGILMAVGTVAALIPSGTRRRPPGPVPVPAPPQAEPVPVGGVAGA